MRVDLYRLRSNLKLANRVKLRSAGVTLWIHNLDMCLGGAHSIASERGAALLPAAGGRQYLILKCLKCGATTWYHSYLFLFAHFRRIAVLQLVTIPHFPSGHLSFFRGLFCERDRFATWGTFCHFIYDKSCFYVLFISKR